MDDNIGIGVMGRAGLALFLEKGDIIRILCLTQ